MSINSISYLIIILTTNFSTRFIVIGINNIILTLVFLSAMFAFLVHGGCIIFLLQRKKSKKKQSKPIIHNSIKKIMNGNHHHHKPTFSKNSTNNNTITQPAI